MIDVGSGSWLFHSTFSARGSRSASASIARQSPNQTLDERRRALCSPFSWPKETTTLVFGQNLSSAKEVAPEPCPAGLARLWPRWPTYSPTAAAGGAWLMGGGKLAASFHAEQLIPRYVISVVPILLGSGIPVFAPHSSPPNLLRFRGAIPFKSGVVQLVYDRDMKATRHGKKSRR
jgi:hypothetical protein